MQLEEIRSIRKSWAAATTSKATTGDMFYRRLFEISPGTKSLFKGDLSEQAMNLVTTMDTIVDHIDRLDSLAPEVSALAIRHTTYGVSVAHYSAVGEAIIVTLKQVLGSRFTEYDEQSWKKAYKILADSMIAAAYPDRDGVS